MFDYRNHVPIVYKNAQILVKCLFGKSDVEFFGTAHPIEVKELLTYNGVVVEDLVEFAEFEQQNLLIISSLDLPVLSHRWCEPLPAVLRDVQSRRVIVGMIRSPLLKV